VKTDKVRAGSEAHYIPHGEKTDATSFACNLDALLKRL